MSINSIMMSFGSFRQIPHQAINEAYGNTVYYTWRAVDRQTTIKLQSFVQDLVAQDYLPTPILYPNDVHMSIIRTENELMNYVPDQQTIQVKPLRWELLGGSPYYYLVLITELHYRVEQQIELAKKQKAKFVFQSFLPHVSVAQYKTKQIEADSLPVPKFKIVLEREERHHFDHTK